MDTYSIPLYTELEILTKNVNFASYQLSDERYQRKDERYKMKRRNKRPTIRPNRRPVDMLNLFFIPMPTNLRKRKTYDLQEL